MKRGLDTLSITADIEKKNIVDQIRAVIETDGYEIVDEDTGRPWGAFFRMKGEQAGRFIEEFFPGLSAEEARRGVEGAELSPKILLVSPAKILSWQYHHYRAERWRFLTPAALYRSMTDEQGHIIHARAGEVVQFEKGERHRLVGLPGEYALVAEIWQHTDPDNPSNEADIVRLQDDYSRH